MATQITATVSVKRAALETQGLSPDSLAFVAERIRLALTNAGLPAEFVDGVTVTAQKIKKGETRGPIGVSEADHRSYELDEHEHDYVPVGRPTA